MTTSPKKPKPETIECTTCHGSGIFTSRSVDGEDVEACWKCEGVGWITQLPHASGSTINSPTMPSQGEISRAKARGDGMQAEHTATLPNEVVWGWPSCAGDLYKFLWDHHHGAATMEELMARFTVHAARALLKKFERHERDNAKALVEHPYHGVARKLRDALVARIRSAS